MARSVVLAVAATLMIGVVAVAGAPGAQAAAWTQNAPGADTVKASKAANPSSMGSVTISTGNNTLKPVPAVDNNGLYGVTAAVNSNIYAISTANAATSTQFTVRPSNGAQMSTMAVDSGVKGRRAGFYTWAWDAGAGQVAGAKPVFFWAEGATAPSDVYYVPLPNYFGHGTYPYYSGGVVNQNTGMLYLGQGECAGIGSNGGARFAIFDPATLTTYWSGQVQPATPSDNLWTTSGNTCNATGYIASGAAVLPNGDFVLVVNGTNKVIEADDPINITGARVNTGAGRVSFLVAIHPSMNNQPWKYSVMKMIASPPGSNVDNFFDRHHYGTAFSNGYLYVATNNYLHEINPLTGYIKQIGTTNPDMFDLGSSQTAAAITGTVRNDSSASGDFDAEADGVPGVTVAIYETGGRGKYTQPTLLGTSVTNGEGKYTFIVPDSDASGETKYFVRVVQPAIDGVAAINTAGAVSSTTEAGATNDSKLTCVDGNIYEGDGAGTVLSGVCSNVKADGTSTSAPLEALGATGDPKTWGTYGEVVMRNTWSESTIDFTISAAKVSYGDAAAGPATIANGAPVHNNSGGATLWLGDTQGVYGAPATDNAAHNSTDDGVYIDSYAGKVPLQGTILAASKTYSLAADVSGDLADQAQVKGWVTAAGNNTWNTNAKWNPTVSNSVAKGDFRFQTGAISGTPTVQMRVNASTTSPSLPTNSSQEYQSGTVNWTTPGEIEDYSFTVQDAVWRPAAVTTGPTGTFTIGGKSLTASSKPTIGSAVGAPASQAVNVTGTAPNANWILVGVSIKDTVTGEVKATPAATTNGLNSTISWTPALGDDVTIEFKYAKSPDPAKSSLTVDKNQAPVGDLITATAKVVDADNSPLAGIEVSFTNKSNPATTLSAQTCTTGADGTCQVTITSDTSGDYPEELSASVPVGGNPIKITGSPRDVAFVAGKADPTKSSLSFSPAGPLTVGDQAANTYTFTALINDSGSNPVPGQTVTFAVTKADGSPVNPAATYLSAATCSTAPAGTCSVTLWSTEAGSFKVTAKVPDPTTSALTEVGAGSPATVAFKPEAPKPGPFTCTVNGVVKPGSSITISPTSLPVAETADITAYVTDKYCNPVPDAAVTFAADKSTAIIGTTTAITDATGHAYSTVTDTTAEIVKVGATTPINGTAAAVDAPKPVEFKATGISYTTSTFTVSPAVSATDAAQTNWRVANNSDAYTVIFTARDAQNNLLGGLDKSLMAFTPSSTDVSVSAIAELSAGVYQVTMTSKVASATPTVGVSYNSQAIKNTAGGTALPIPFKAGTPKPGPFTCPDGRTGSSLTVNPTTSPVGGSSTVTAFVTDENCNIISNARVNFSNDGSSTLSAASAITGADGKATTTLRDNTAEVVTVGATATANGATTAVDADKTVTFTAGSVDPAKSHVVVGPPSTQTAGTPVVVTVTVRDSNDNPVPNLKASDFALTGKAAGLPDLVFTNFAPGPNGTYTFKTTSKLEGTFQVRANVQSVLLEDAPTATFVPGDICVNNCESIDNPETTEDESLRRTRIVMVDNDQWADGTTKDTARAYAYDMYGNPVAGAVFTVTDASTGQMAGHLKPATQTVTTGADGTAMVEWTSHKPGTYTATTTVKSGTLTEGVAVGNSNLNSIRFSTGHASAGTSVLSVSPTSAQPVGQSFTATATIVDGAGNPLAGETVSFYVDDPSVTLSARTCQTPASGKCSITVTSKKAGDYLVHATISEYGLPTDIGYELLEVQASPQTVSFYAKMVCVEGVDECEPIDDPDTTIDESKENFTRVVIVTNNASADGTDRDAVAVYAYDQYGNPVKDAQVRISTTDAMLNLLTTTATTDAQGVARFEATSTVAGPHTATVTVAGKNPQGSPTTLNFTAGSVADVVLTINPAGNLPVGSAFTVTAHVADATGNGLDKAVVSFALPSGLTTPGGATNATCTTNEAGDCTIQVTSTKTGPYNVIGKVGQVQSNSVTARFTAGAPSAENSTVVVTRDGAGFDGMDRDIVTVTVRDQYNNLVPDAEVSSTPVNGKASGLGVQPDIHPTGADGTTTIWYTSTEAGAKQADVRINGDLIPTGSPVTVRFGNGAGDPNHSAWTLSPATALPVGSDAGSQFTLEATVRDVFDEAVLGAVVTFDVDQATTAWGDQGRTCTTDESGKCSVTVTSTKAGTYSFTAGLAVGQIGQAKTAVWTPDVVCGSCSKVTVTTDNATADGADADVVTVEAVDKYGNPVPGQLVTSEPGQADLSVGTGIPFTDVNGKTTITYSATKSGPHTATVAIGTTKVVPNGSPVTLNFKAGEPEDGPMTCADGKQGTSMDVRPATTSVGDKAVATALVTDKYCNPVPGVEVTFAADGDATFSPVKVVTGADGKASAEVTDKKAETVNVTGSFPSNGNTAKVDNPKQVTFTASAPNPNPTCADGKIGTNLSVNPASVVIPATSSATAYVTDEFCNPVGAGVSVTFSVTGSGKVSAVTVVTDADSRAVVTVSDAKPESINVTAKLGTAAIKGSPAKVTFLDETAPEAPAITGPKGGDLTNDDPLVIEGTGEPGAVVEVTDGDDVVCKAVVGADGKWSCTVSLEDGDHHLEATQTDPSGNKSDPSDPVEVTVDTTAPSAEITSADKDGITGKADPDSTVTINYPKKDGTTGTITTTVDPDGTWSVPTPDDAASGTIEVWATDPAGNVSDKETALIDLDAPGAPTIETANEEGITGKADPSTTDPGDTVLVKDKDGNVICSTTVQDDMTWSCTLDPEVGHSVDGPITAVVVDPAGNESEPGNGVLDTQAPDAPVVTSPAPGKEVNDSTPTVEGTGEPGATVTVKDGEDNVLCTAVVGADGTWSCTVTQELEDGPATLVVTQTDPSGNVSEEVVIEIVVDTTPPNPPVVEGGNKDTITGSVPGPVDPGTIVTVTDPDGEVLCVTTVNPDGTWTCLTPDSVTNDTVITVVTEDPAGNKSDPVTYPLDVTPPGKPTVDVANGNEVTGTVPGDVDPGTIVVITWPDGSTSEVEVGPDGKWTVKTPEGMTEGDITVVAKDPAGNVSDQTTAELDVTPPKAPVVNPSTGSEITGSGEPGGSVTVTDPEGKPVPGCEDVLINSDGKFSCRPTTPLNPGDVINVTVTDPSGNVSEPTTVVIGKLGIEVAYAERHRLETQVVTGTNFSAGEQVCLYVYSTPMEVGCAAADDQGKVTISFKVPAELEIGAHAVELQGERSGKVAAGFTVIDVPAIITGGTVSSTAVLPGLIAALTLAAAGLWVYPKKQRQS